MPCISDASSRAYTAFIHIVFDVHDRCCKSIACKLKLFPGIVTLQVAGGADEALLDPPSIALPHFRNPTPSVILLFCILGAIR